MPFMTIRGIRTYYETHGEGESLVLLHNGFSCAMMWEEIFPILTAEGYRVILYDRRGYGRSEEGPDFERYYTGPRFREESVAAMEELLDILGVVDFHIVGQCEGGVVGVDFTLAHPHRVRTLTMASTLCFSKTSMEIFNREKFPDSFRGLTPEIQRKYVRWHGPERAEAFFNLCSRYGGAYGRGVFDLRPVLGEISCPVLVMYPDRGYFFEVEQGLALYRHLPAGELAVFPKCGHNIHEHYPRQYAEQVLNFLERWAKTQTAAVHAGQGSS